MSEASLVLLLATCREFAQQNESNVFCFTLSFSLASLCLSVCLLCHKIYAVFLFGFFFEGARGATVWHSDAKVKWLATETERERTKTRKRENSVELLQVCCDKILR